MPTRISNKTKAKPTAASDSLAHGIIECSEAKKTAENSETDYRAIFDAANDAIFIHDAGTDEILDVNQKMLDMYGYSREEARGLTLENLSSGEPPYSQEDALQWIRKAAAGEPQLFDWLARHKSGRQFWVEVNLKQVTLNGKDCMLAMVRDITDRKGVEDALQRSEARYRAVVEDQSELICRFLADGTLTFVNQAYCRYFRKEHKELIGHSCMPFILPEDQEWVKGQFTSLSPEDPIAIYEHRVRGANQEIRWLQRSDRALFDKRGTLVEFQSVARDVTDRKQAAEALWESEERYRSFIHAFHGIAFQANLDFVPQFFHGAVEEITGYTESEFTAGKPRWDQIIHPDDESGIHESHKKIRSIPGWSTEREYRIIRKDNQVRWVQEFVKNKYDDFGKPAVVLGAIYDVTVRKLAEEKLRASEKRFHDIALSSADWIWEVDADGKYSFVSGRVKQILGYEPEEVIGKTPFELMPHDEAERVRETFSEIASRKKPIVDLENWNLTKQAERVCLLTNGVPILDDQDNLVGYRGLDKDITECKQLQKAERQSEPQNTESEGII